MIAKSGKRKSLKSQKRSAGLRTFAVDVGGTGTKSVLLNAAGRAISKFQRVETPRPATPRAVLSVIAEMAENAGDFDRVALGFPGVVRNGKVQTAPHLDPTWVGVDLERLLEKELGKPARVGNDAAVQGSAAISGKGIEMVITLGTSMGSALYVNGHVIPNEMGHHPYRKGKTYEDEIGEEARKKAGKNKWNKRLQDVIELLNRTFNYDRLYIGGGNAKRISFKLPTNARIIDNTEGLFGALALWKE